MGALHEYTKIRKRIKEENREEKLSINKNVEKIQNIIDCAREEKRTNLIETEARQILSQYDIPMSTYQLAKNQSQAIKIAKDIGFPIAMKVVSPDILHKSEAKGIILNIKNQKEAKNAFVELIKRAKVYNKNADIRGVIVTPMERQDIELIVGVSKDKTFGPTIMFGLGGIYVEALKDVSFRVAPLSKVDALDMIKETKCFSILKGIRGQKGINIDALTSLLLKISTLAIDNPEIDEIDLNPIFAYEENLSIIDARITIQN
jgi:acetyl-CoA synthetase (ADP-forming)